MVSVTLAPAHGNNDCLNDCDLVVGGEPAHGCRSSTQRCRAERTFGSYHPGICQFVLGDGSVRPIATNLSPEILRLLVVRNDGQPIPDF